MSTRKWLKNSGSLRSLAIWIAVLLIWEGAYRFIGWKEYVFPAPTHVLDAAVAMLNGHTYFGEALHEGWPWKSIAGEVAPRTGTGPVWQIPLVQGPLVSGVRLVVGFGAAIVLGNILGLTMWRWPAVDQAVGPLFLGLQTLPSVCWVPLAILLFGLKESGILFVLVMGSCFAIAIALRDGLRMIPSVYQRAGLMLGARGWRLYRYVLLPASLPALASSLRQGFSFAWRSLMGAEVMLVAVQWHGLGYFLELGRSFQDAAQVVVVMAIMVLLGMVADRMVFARLEKRVHARFGLNGGK